MIILRIGIILHLHRLHQLPPPILQIHIHNNHFVIGLNDQFLHLPAVAYLLDLFGIVQIFSCGVDAMTAYFLDVATVGGCGGHVGGGEFVEEGLVFDDHFGDRLVVYWDADLVFIFEMNCVKIGLR